jgi:hypothetical protein
LGGGAAHRHVRQHVGDDSGGGPVPQPGLDDDFDFLTPLETSGQGSPDAPRRGRWLLVGGAVALVGITAWAVTSGTTHQATPVPSPTPSGTHQSPTPVITSVVGDLALNDGQPYARLDSSRRTAVVVVPLANNDSNPVSLDGVEVTGTDVPVTASVLPLAQAASYVFPTTQGASGSTAPTPEPGPVTLAQGLSAALVVAVTPDCAVTDIGPAPTVTVHGSMSVDGKPARSQFVWLGAHDSPEALTWLADAVASVCRPHTSPPSALATVTQVVRGVRMTTSGPLRPPLQTPVDVTLTATNTTQHRIRASLGVMLVDSTRSNGFSPMLGPDQFDTRPGIVGSGYGGVQVRGVTPLESAVLAKDQALAPGATLTITFHVDVSPGTDLIGPTRGWLPALVLGSDVLPVPVDVRRYPAVTLPR